MSESRKSSSGCIGFGGADGRTACVGTVTSVGAGIGCGDVEGAAAGDGRRLRMGDESRRQT